MPCELAFQPLRVCLQEDVYKRQKGIRIDNEPRLQMVVGLREKKTSLKVLLSVGGWGSSRFSEMAQTDSCLLYTSIDGFSHSDKVLKQIFVQI